MHFRHGSRHSSFPEGRGSQSRPRRRQRQPQAQLLLWLLLACSITVASLLFLVAQIQGSSGHNQHESMNGQAARLMRELPASCAAELRDAGLAADAPATLSRRLLYSAMAAAFEHQRSFRGSHIQGLSMPDIFRVSETGVLTPVLTHLKVPVRAVVTPITAAHASRRLAEAAVRHLVPLFLSDDSIWLQNSSLFHSTLFHASFHAHPVPADAAAVASEAEAVGRVAAAACPLHIVLERVVATSSGAVLALWQVTGGTDPSALRNALAEALPRAPLQQGIKDLQILHTTLARIVKPGAAGSGGGSGRSSIGRPRKMAPASEEEEASEAVRQAAARMTADLCGLQATLDTIWFVQEYDKLALALDGSFSKQPLPLRCEGQRQGSDAHQEGGSSQQRHAEHAI